jgi:hypothetical protein
MLLRVSDLNAVYADPDRYEAERIWHPYAKQVTAVAFGQGDRESVFIKKWQELLEKREVAEEYNDAAALRRVDAQLERHVGVPYSSLPNAAWDAVERLPEPERRFRRRRPLPEPGTKLMSVFGTSFPLWETLESVCVRSPNVP